MTPLSERRRQTRERGAAALEFLGVIPVLVLTAIIALQLGIVGWTVVAAADAARAGARADALNLDPQAAAQEALPGRLSQGAALSGTHSGEGYRFTVGVRVPSLVPGLQLPMVHRTADMPNIGG